MSLFHFILLAHFLCLMFLRVLAGSVGRIGTKYMKVLNYMSDTVSHLNVIKGYTRRWGKMTSQIHRLTLHLTGYYKETQQSRHNAWQQKIENKCLQNDDEKRVFFSISMFFFFPHYGTRRTMPCTNKNNDCNQRNAQRIMHWHFRRTETYWLTTALVCARQDWLCFLHGVWGKLETSSDEMSPEMNIAPGDIRGNTISLTGSNLEGPHFKCKSQQERAWPSTG